jgi:hypothetical protein
MIDERIVGWSGDLFVLERLMARTHPDGQKQHVATPARVFLSDARRDKQRAPLTAHSAAPLNSVREAAYPTDSSSYLIDI